MEMKENSQKKVLLSVLGVAILVVAVVGITFAAFTASGSTGDNEITTGTIMVSYSEPSAAISMSDVIPISDTTGKALTGTNNTFDFTISTSAANAVTIPYTIWLVPTSSSTITGTEVALADSKVKVYLTEVVSGSETQVVAPTLVSGLTAGTGDRSTSYVLYQDSDVYSASGSLSTNYKLRLWVDANAADIDTSKVNVFSAKVDVTSDVTPLSNAS